MSRLSAGIWATAGAGFGAVLGKAVGQAYETAGSGYFGPPLEKELEAGRKGAVIGGLIGAALGAVMGTDSEKTLREQVCPQLSQKASTGVSGHLSNGAFP